MSISVFGPSATVSILNRAFNDISPANAIFKNQVAQATAKGENAFAIEFGQSFKDMPSAELSIKVLSNLGLLPNQELQDAVTVAFDANRDARGQVVLNMGKLLSNLEGATGNLAIYASAAVAWNSEVTTAFIYSDNTANVVDSTPGEPAALASDNAKTASTAAHDKAVLSAAAAKDDADALAPLLATKIAADTQAARFVAEDQKVASDKAADDAKTAADADVAAKKVVVDAQKALDAAVSATPTDTAAVNTANANLIVANSKAATAAKAVTDTAAIAATTKASYDSAVADDAAAAKAAADVATALTKATASGATATTDAANDVAAANTFKAAAAATLTTTADDALAATAVTNATTTAAAAAAAVKVSADFTNTSNAASALVAFNTAQAAYVKAAEKATADATLADTAVTATTSLALAEVAKTAAATAKASADAALIAANKVVAEAALLKAAADKSVETTDDTGATAGVTTGGDDVIAANMLVSNAGMKVTTAATLPDKFVAKLFALTVSQDTTVGASGDDVFTAGVAQNGAGKLINTLQNVDSLNGGDGAGDTLNVTLDATDAGAADIVTPTLTSIENVNLRVTKTGSALDLTGSTGVKTLTVANSTAATGTITSVGDASLAIKNQNTDVWFSKSTATTLALTLDTVGVKGTHAIVDLGKTAAAAATTLAITANNAYEDITATNPGTVTTVTVAATGTNRLKLTDAAATATTITVTGTGSIDFKTNGVALTAVKTLTVGDGGVTIDATGGVLETATTGAAKDSITVVGTNVKSVSTGGGDDSVSTVTSALAATSVVDLGAGADTLTLSHAPTAGVTLTGGADTDTLAVVYADYNSVSGFTAAQLAKITGFETLSITTAALANGNTVDVSKISGLVSAQILGVANTAAASITNIGANSTVVVKGNAVAGQNDGSLTVSLKDATGSSDVLNLTINQNITQNNDATVNTFTSAITGVTATGIETINFTSTGNLSAAVTAGNKTDVAVNGLALTNNTLVTLNVMGDQGFTFTSAAGMTKLATVDASANTAGGSISIAASAASSAAITVKGSTTAANTITGSANADTIVAGGKGDTITGGAGADVMTAGAGKDIFVLAAATDSTLVATDTITGFAANTFGQGTSGAANQLGATATLASRTGDVIDLTFATPATLELLVVGNAADAQTFLQNASTDTTFTSVNVALDSSSSKLYVDIDNNGTVDSVILLVGATTITTAAFVI